MKTLTYTFVVLLLMVATSTRAQQPVSGSPAASYGILENKLKKSNENLTNEKKNTNPKFWLQRAELMMDIYDVNRQYITNGATPTQIKLFFQDPKDTKTWQKGSDSYEEYIYDRVNIIFKNGVVDSLSETKKIYDTPLVDAYSAIQKAQELDTEHKQDKTIDEDYTRLKGMLQRKGVEQFMAKDFKGAFNTFSDMIAIDSLPSMKDHFDTLICYYTGMAASRAGMPETAIKYYELSVKYNVKQPDVYVFLKQRYFDLGDTATGVAKLKEGFSKNPDNQAVLIELINYYLASGQGDQAMNYLKMAQEQDPDNLSFIFAEATLYDKMGDQDKALKTYERCIDKDPTYFNAYYNIGVMFYNKAVNMYQAANDEKDPNKYGEMRDEADSILQKCLPYMEKAHELQPKDIGTLQTLKTLYYRLQMNDKYQQIQDELQSAQPAKKADELQ